MDSRSIVFTKETEISGFWWPADDPEQRLPGKLVFSPAEGLTLELMGAFPHDKFENPFGVTVLGESTFKENVTLHQVYLNESRTLGSLPGTGLSTCVAVRAYVGAHIPNSTDVEFKIIKYYPFSIEQWLRNKTIDYDFPPGGFEVKFNNPEPLSFKLTDDLTFGLSYQSSGLSINPYGTDINFKYVPIMSLESKQPVSWNRIGELITTLNNFLSLPIMEPVFSLDVQGTILLPSTKEGDETQEEVEIKVLLPLYDTPVGESPHPVEMLYTFDDISEVFPEYLANWFEKEALLGPVYDLFFDSFSGKRTNLVTTFLNYAQALETYHIRTMEGDIDPPKIHKKRLEEIRSSVPEEYKEWVRENLISSNRKTLKMRLKELIELNPTVVNGRAGDHDAFIKRVKDTRNYYTHYVPTLEERAAAGGRLKGLIITLGLLIEGLLLYQMGFDIPKIQELQRSRKRYPPVWY